MGCIDCRNENLRLNSVLSQKENDTEPVSMLTGDHRGDSSSRGVSSDIFGSNWHSGDKQFAEHDVSRRRSRGNSYHKPLSARSSRGGDVYGAKNQDLLVKLQVGFVLTGIVCSYDIHSCQHSTIWGYSQL